MSHDSKDEEIKAILAKVNSNDSKESNKSKEPETNKISDTIKWETNKEEDDDSEW